MTTTFESHNSPLEDDDDFYREDPKVWKQESLRLALERQDREFELTLSQRGFQTMPQAIRKLYRQNPSNPRFRELYDSLVRELYERTDDKLQAALLPAVDRMVDLIDDDDPKVALRAATYVFERLRGKTPDVIEHRQDKPFQVMLERVVAGPRSLAAASEAAGREDVPIEAEIVAERLSAAPTGEASEPPDSGNASPEVRRRIRELTTRPFPQVSDVYAEERAMMREWGDEI